MYKTGDLGRWLTDGNIEYLGRNDFQLKIRGFRIELGEIEAQLMRCAGVREAIVCPRVSATGDKQLVAYVTAHDGALIDSDRLRRELSAQLPSYMLPAAYVMLSVFPLNANGKVDRQALPAADVNVLSELPYCAPQTETEIMLAAQWQELLGVERVGRDDHFFSLGGHSLLAARLATRLRPMLGIELSLRDLFQTPVLRQQADLLNALQLQTFSTDELISIEDELENMTEEELLMMLQKGGIH